MENEQRAVTPDAKPTTVERVAALKEKLKAGVAQFVSGDDWKAHLKQFSSPGPRSALRYSFNNQVLLVSQAEERAKKGSPVDLSQVATFAAWKDAGRLVRKGESALWILKPSQMKDKKRLAKLREEAGGRELTADEEGRCSFTLFGLLPVFCISQTDGEELPAAAMPELATDDGWGAACAALTKVALADGVPAVSFRGRRPLEHPRALGWCNLITREITVITEGQTRADQFATAVHELAHATLHCGDGRDPHSRAHNEVEAESIAYIVCAAMGLDTSACSFGYVRGWALGEDPAQQIEQSGRRIMATACKIIDALANVDRAAALKGAA